MPWLVSPRVNVRRCDCWEEACLHFLLPPPRRRLTWREVGNKARRECIGSMVAETWYILFSLWDSGSDRGTGNQEIGQSCLQSTQLYSYRYQSNENRGRRSIHYCRIISRDAWRWIGMKARDGRCRKRHRQKGPAIWRETIWAVLIIILCVVIIILCPSQSVGQ